jgi:hypothetical protein
MTTTRHITNGSVVDSTMTRADTRQGSSGLNTIIYPGPLPIPVQGEFQTDPSQHQEIVDLLTAILNSTGGPTSKSRLATDEHGLIPWLSSGTHLDYANHVRTLVRYSWYDYIPVNIKLSITQHTTNFILKPNNASGSSSLLTLPTGTLLLVNMSTRTVHAIVTLSPNSNPENNRYGLEWNNDDIISPNYLLRLI